MAAAAGRQRHGTEIGQRRGGRRRDSARGGCRRRGRRRGGHAGQPKPFADVVKDAKEIPGLFKLWQKDDKVWIEIAPDQFDQIYFFQANLSQGIGENRIYGGMMAGYPFGPEQVVAFHKIGNTVQLLAKNVKYTAKAGTPEARAVAQAFSDSLLASTPVVSQPHPERKSVLIEANALLLADIPGATSVLERIYRQSYSFDARNSSLAKVRGTPEMVTFAVTAHYSLSRISLPPANPSPGSPPPTELAVDAAGRPQHVPRASTTASPSCPTSRCGRASLDERLGYFWTDRFDYTSDTPRAADRPLRQPLAPGEEGSGRGAVRAEAADRVLAGAHIPERYRPAVREGILEWNKAFERIGYKDAIRVEVQPDDADWDAADVHRASVRWMTTARPGFGAIGPSTVDPRTGEILDADIGFDANARPQRPPPARRADCVRRPRAARGARERHGAATTRTARRRRRASRSTCSRRAARSRPTVPTPTNSSTRTSRT